MKAPPCLVVVPVVALAAAIVAFPVWVVAMLALGLAWPLAALVDAVAGAAGTQPFARPLVDRAFRRLRRPWPAHWGGGPIGSGGAARDAQDSSIPPEPPHD